MTSQPDPIDTGSSPLRQVTVVNESSADRNICILARPRSVEVHPSAGQMRLLAWRVALIPGRSGGVTSRRHFVWRQTASLVLGRHSLAVGGGFLAEAAVPLRPDVGRSVAVGFVGSPSNGAAKVLGIEPGKDAAEIHFDGSFPPSARRGADTRDMAFAVAIEADPDGGGSAVTVPIEPNVRVRVSDEIDYWAAVVGAEVSAAEAVPTDILDAARALDFEDAASIRLAFTERNAFDLVP